MKRISKVIVLAAVCLAIVAGTALAHVSVQPSTSLPGAFETYTIKIPNEKTIPTVGIRLSIPSGAKFSSSGVKNGWIFKQVKDGNRVKDIEWTGGEIPAERFDTFQFSVQNPAETADVAWKAYQTYADGSVVAWIDVEEEGEENAHGGDSKPASITKIAEEDGEEKPAASEESGGSHGGGGEDEGETNNSTDNTFAYIAIGLALLAMVIAIGRNRSS